MTIESLPLSAIPQEPLPKARRTPGRKPATDPITGERLHKPRPPGGAKRRAAPARGTASRARGPKSLRPEIAALLTMVNSVVVMSPLGTRPIEAITDPTVELSRLGDELDAGEITALASAIDAQCQRSPRFRKYVESMLGVGSGGALITTLAMIAARRASRHGIAPPMLDPMLGMILNGDGMEALTSMQPPAPPSVPDPVTGEMDPRSIDYESTESLGMAP